MKNYFNAIEREQHIFMIALQAVLKLLSQSEALTGTEKADLIKANEFIESFNNSVFNRFGDAYKRRVNNTVQVNKIRLVGKYSEKQEMISVAAEEDLNPMLDKIIEYFCMDCEKDNYKDCPVYNMGIACDCEIKSEKGCPFRL